MVQGDLDPPAEITILDGNGDPVDLTLADTITFQAKHQDKPGGFSGLCTAVTPFIDTVTHLPTGKAVYNWNAGDTDKVGWYYFNTRVVWQDGRPQTFPNYTFKQLQIRASA